MALVPFGITRPHTSKAHPLQASPQSSSTPTSTFYYLELDSSGTSSFLNAFGVWAAKISSATWLIGMRRSLAISSSISFRDGSIRSGKVILPVGRRPVLFFGRLVMLLECSARNTLTQELS